MALHRSIQYLSLICGLALLAPGAQASGGDTTSRTTEARVNAVAQTLAHELGALCPVAAPDNQAAFEKCRQGLFNSRSEFRALLPDYVLWGRVSDPKRSLKDTNLTQFGPDVISGLYLSLFMFNGKNSVQYVPSEGLYQIRLQTAFRNRLTPGQFPYPFWHEEVKWSTYEKANEILVWWDPAKDRIKALQFTPFGATAPLAALEPVAHAKFDGKWLWTDAQGRTQPKVTVFDGLFQPQNPYLGQLDTAYKTVALRLREGQCDECHVPNNPDKMKRLVLLQTPAHAAAEIKRVIQSVREDKMPRDEAGIEQPLPSHIKGPLLRDSEAFDKLYEAAKKWEQESRATAVSRRAD